MVQGWYEILCPYPRPLAAKKISSAGNEKIFVCCLMNEDVQCNVIQDVDIS